jgi:hypothetical protein
MKLKIKLKKLKLIVYGCVRHIRVNTNVMAATLWG